MKKLILSISAIFLFGMLSAQTEQTNATVEEKSEITFVSLEHNYGQLEFNANSTYQFEFTNTGKVVLVLNDVKASCGCTTPEWSREPIKPGEKGKITVKYNTMIPGPFHKTITVYSNAKVNPIVLTIQGEVKPQVQQPTQSSEQK